MPEGESTLSVVTVDVEASKVVLFGTKYIAVPPRPAMTTGIEPLPCDWDGPISTVNPYPGGIPTALVEDP